jgi:hypothetical protein
MVHYNRIACGNIFTSNYNSSHKTARKAKIGIRRMTAISGLRRGDFRDHPDRKKKRYPESGPEKEEEV